MVHRASDGESQSGEGPSTRPAPDRGSAPDHREGDLEIEQDLGYQFSSWRMQRVGWVAIAAVILAALSGLFGSGPLSRTSAVDPRSRAWLEYDRFGRQMTPATLRLHLEPGSAAGGRVRVWIDSVYLEDILIQKITPRPDREEVGPGRSYYLFTITTPDRPTVVTFHLQPERFGVLSGRVGVDDGTPLRFRQLIYP